MSELPERRRGRRVTGLDSSPVQAPPADLPPLTDQARLEAREIIARYPVARSALLPMLHLVQSYQGYVTPEGVALCAEELGLTKAEVGRGRDLLHDVQAPADRPALVSVCTNTLCAVLGGERIMDALRPTSASTTTRPPPTARSPSSTPSAWPPATTRRWSRSTTSSTTSRTSRARVCWSRRCAGREAAAHPGRPAHRFPRRLPPAGRLLPARRRGRRPCRRRQRRRARPDAGRAAPGRAARRVRTGHAGAGEPGRDSSSGRRRPRPRRRVAQRGAPEPAGRDTGDGGGTDTPAGQEPGTRGQGPEGPAAPSRAAVGREGRADQCPSPRPDHPLGRRGVLAAGHLRAARGLLGAADGAVDGARRARRAGQGLRPARPRRRRLPDRHEVVLHPAAGDRPGAQAASTSWSTPTRASRVPARTCR